jgi:glycosyltransferase involved in cell wall biosynthesis
MRFWRNLRTDVLQVYFLDSVYFGVPLARLAGVRRVVRVRNNLGHWLTPRHRWLGRVMGQLADVTLTNCEPARRALLQAEGGSVRKVRVLENGVDVQHFAALRPPNGRRTPRIGAVANLRPVKAIDLLIRAARRVLTDRLNASFHVAGDGEQRPELERLIAELRLQGRFVLHGALADIPGFLATLDVAVLCSHAEGMSNAVLEAMAAGRPVVATDVGANGHLLRNGELGVLVPPGDEGALAEAIHGVLDDPARSARLGEQARRHVQTHYSRDAMRRRFEDFYARLCA